MSELHEMRHETLLNRIRRENFENLVFICLSQHRQYDDDEHNQILWQGWCPYCRYDEETVIAAKVLTERIPNKCWLELHQLQSQLRRWGQLHDDGGSEFDDCTRNVNRQAADLAKDLYVTIVNRQGQLVVATGVFLGPEEAIEIHGLLHGGRVYFDLRPMKFRRFRNRQTDLQQISVNISVCDMGIRVSCEGIFRSESDEEYGVNDEDYEDEEYGDGHNDDEYDQDDDGNDEDDGDDDGYDDDE